MEKGRIFAFVVGLLAGLVAAVLLLNDTEMYDDEGPFDDAVLGETEVRLSLVVATLLHYISRSPAWQRLPLVFT